MRRYRVGGSAMKRIATTVRCVPRYGYDYTQVREVDLELPEGWDDHQLNAALSQYFSYKSIADAVFAIDSDEGGFFAVINDEAYLQNWGEPLI